MMRTPLSLLALALLTTTACSAGSDSIQSADLSEPADSVQPADSGEPVDSIQSADLGEPVDSVQPAVSGTPVSARLVADPPPGFQWDVSPNGEWMSYAADTRRACFIPVGVDEPETCVDLGDRRIGALRWSPDSSRVVVVPDTARTLIPGPLVVVSVTDGSTTEIAGPPDESELAETPLDAAFLDDATILYHSLSEQGDPAAQFWSIDVDGSDRRLLAEFGPVGDEPAPLPDLGLFPLDDSTVLMPLRRPVRPSGLSEYDLDAGTFRELVPGGREVRPSGPSAVQAVDGVVVIADVHRLGNFIAEAREGALWSVLVDERLTTVPDRGFYRAQAVALSPSGDLVAVLERYVGEDSDGVRDPNRSNMTESLDASRLSVTSIDSLVAGNPEWSDLTGFSANGVVADYDGQATGVVWTEPDRLFLEMADGLFEVELAPQS